MADKYTGKLRWQKGICGVCPTGCWAEIGYDKSGRIRSIRNDDSHSLGMLCPRGRCASEIIYSSDRLLTPLKRTGKKGEGKFSPISWDEAYCIIAERLNLIKERHGAEQTAIYTGRGANELSLCDIFQPKGVAVSSASSVLFPFGSPNTMGVGALCYVSLAMIAPHVTMGRMQVNMFTDIENAEAIFVWGTNPATDSPPVDMQRLEIAAERGADIYVIDPRKTEAVTRTGGKWIPIRAGTDGALALSIINVLIEEGLYDDDFAQNWCLGFSELKHYVQHFSPSVVEGITGIPAGTIVKLARVLEHSNGVSLLMYTGLEYSNSGVQAIRAIYTLFALAGQLDVPGGMGLNMLEGTFPINRSCNRANPNVNLAIGRDKYPVYTKYRAESHGIALIDSVLKDSPYPIRGLIIHGSSLSTSWPQSNLWRAMLSRLEFLVCIDRQKTADMKFADIILPATTMFENLSYMVYGPIFRVRERLIEPLGEARNDYLIMAGLASALGYGELYPQTEEEMIDFALKGSGHMLKSIRDKGGWVQIPSPIIQYKKWEKGLLRPDGKKGFDTPSGKFEIHSNILDEYGYEPLPKYTEVKESPLGSPELLKKYPLIFNSGARPHNDFRTQFHNTPCLNRNTLEPLAEINPQDALKRGIENGDLIKVSTLRGAVNFRAKVSEGIMQGTIECNMGGGTPVGPKAWQKWNVNELTDLSNYDEISGFPIYKALLCEAEKVKSGNAEEKAQTGIGFEVCNYSAIVAKSSVKRRRKRIYLDNNATTKIDPEVKKVISKTLGLCGNPSSIHHDGIKARNVITEARRSIAKLVNCPPKSIIFTGSGSEADNTALTGTAYALKDKGNHIITSKIEHPALLNTCKFLEAQGFEVTYLDVDKNGLVSPDDLEKAINGNTILVSIMAVNNETGVIQHVKELCRISHQKGVFFHTDAVQAVGKIKVDMKEWGVDMLSLSAHKIHGPKGVGVLCISEKTQILPLIHGGKQERGLRAGTENTAGIAGAGKASLIALAKLSEYENIKILRDKLKKEIIRLVPGAVVNGGGAKRVANTLNITLPELRGESIVIALDQRGISLSSGSACKSGSPEPTHVLLAMGKTEEEAHSALRFSLSRYTTESEINATIKTLAGVLKEMKTFVRLLPCK